MRRASVRFRLWMTMGVVAVFAGAMAEISLRRERLARLCVAHHERAEACFDRSGRICKQGETPQSIEAFYRRQRPAIWADYRTGLHHLALADQYERAANRPGLPRLWDFPPLDEFRDVRSLADWGLEAVMEAVPLFGILVLLLTIRTATAKTGGSPSATRPAESSAQTVKHRAVQRPQTADPKLRDDRSQDEVADA